MDGPHPPPHSPAAAPPSTAPAGMSAPIQDADSLETPAPPGPRSQEEEEEEEEQRSSLTCGRTGAVQERQVPQPNRPRPAGNRIVTADKHVYIHRRIKRLS